MKKIKHPFLVINGGNNRQNKPGDHSPASLKSISLCHFEAPADGDSFDNELAIERIREEFDNAWGREYKCMVVVISEKTDNLRFLNYRKNDNPILRVNAFRDMQAFYDGDNDPEWTVLMAVDTDLLLENQVPSRILNSIISLKTLKVTPVINHLVYNPHRISTDDLTI